MEGVDHTAKAFFDLILTITGKFKRLEHDFRLVVADRPGHQFVAVTGQIILIAQNLQRIAQKRVHPTLRHRERVVFKVDLAAVLILLVDREINDPGKFERIAPVLILGGFRRLFPDHGAGFASDTLEGFRFAAQEKGRIANPKTKLLTDRFGAFRADVFGERTGSFHLPVGFAPKDIPHPRQALLLGEFVHPVAEFARAAFGGRNGADFVALLLQKRGKNGKARATEMLGHVLHLDRVAQVGLVGAVPQRGIAIGDLRPIAVRQTAFAECVEHPGDHRLHRVKNILLGDKGHFHVELVEIGRRAVSTRVFVAETRRDLEIFVKARDHEQLFELLRRLRQGVEFARMQPRRHQEVARAFGGGCGDDRCLEFVEPVAPHALTQIFDHVGTQDHVLLHRLTTQVEVAVFQAGLFRVFLITKDHERQFCRCAQHFEIADKHFNLAGGEFGVYKALIAGLHGAINADTPFRADLFHGGKRRAVRVAKHLSDTIVITQIDKEDTPMVTDAMHPTRQADSVANIGCVQIGAGMAAIDMH